MKKLVTIRKSPTGEGKFINKTQKFLEKAQMGQAVQPEYNQKVLEYVAEHILEKKEDPQEVYQSLIESKLEPEIAQFHIEAIMEYQQNMQASQQQQPMSQEQVAEANPYADDAEEIRQDMSSQYGYNDPSGVAQELAQDDSTDQGYDEENPEDEDYMQDGGSINDYVMHNYLPAFTDSSAEDLNALQYAKGGTTDKRSFMRNVMKELKQAREGMQQEQGQNETFDRTDTLTLDRNKKKNDFVQALAQTTQEAKDKQAAEQQWQMQQQPPMPMINKEEGGDTEHPYHHLAMFDEANHNMMSEPMNARFAGGGFAMPSPREYRKMHRTVNRALPNMYLDPNIKHTNMNVTDTDWLGRPKEYSMDFQGQQGIMPSWMNGRLMIGLPGGSNQGMSSGGGWGSSWNNSSYTSTKKGIKEVTKVKKEGIIRAINKASDPQLHTKTSYDQDASGVPDNIQSDPLKIESTTPVQYDQDQNNQLDVTQTPGVSSYNNISNPGSGVLLQGNQFGGFVDPESELYKFVYGGNDPAFDDYQNSINTADPYAGRMYRSGGFPKFPDGGWVTKANGETVWMTEDGKIDLTKKMDATEKTTYDENVLKGHKDYYTQNKDKFADPAEQQKLIDAAVQKRMQEYQQQQQNNQGNNQQNYNDRYGQRFNPNYRSAPGQKSAGFLGSLLSADLAPNYLGTWSKMKGMKTSDGMPFTGFDDKTFLNKVQVTKSDWRNRPKEYTMNFSKSGVPINPADGGDKNVIDKDKNIIDKDKNVNVLDKDVKNLVSDDKNKQNQDPRVSGPGKGGSGMGQMYLDEMNFQNMMSGNTGNQPGSTPSVTSGKTSSNKLDPMTTMNPDFDYMAYLNQGQDQDSQIKTETNTNNSNSGQNISKEQLMTVPGGAGYQDFNQNNIVPNKPKYGAPVTFGTYQPSNPFPPVDTEGNQYAYGGGTSSNPYAGYAEGGIAYMTADEMQQFMAAGGQIEFI
jgi:hypothetical protein